MFVNSSLPQHVTPTVCNTPSYPPMQPKFKEIVEKEKAEKEYNDKRVFSFHKQNKQKKKSLKYTPNRYNNYSTVNLTQSYQQTTIPTSTYGDNFGTEQSDYNNSMAFQDSIKKMKEKYQSVTSLNSKGVQQLRDMPSKNQMKQIKFDQEWEEQQVKNKDYAEWIKKYQKKRPQSSVPQGKGLKMGIHFSEYEMTDDLHDNYIIEIDPKNELYDTYEEQLKKFKQMVFDKQGNFKYSKFEKLNKEEQVKLEEIQNAKKTHTKMSENHEKRLISQKFQPGKTIEKIVKSAQEKATMHPRKKVLLEIKEKSFKTLNTMMHISVKEKIIDLSKQEVAKSCQEMMNEVDKLQREIDVLKRECQKSKDNIVDMKNEAERQNEKNHLLQNNLDDMKIKFDDLKKNVENIEQFIPEYTLLNERFPKLTATEIIMKYNKMEDLITEQQTDLGQKEEEKTNQEKQIVAMKQNYQRKTAEMVQKDLQRQKQTALELQSYKEKNLELENALEYKQRYIELTKNIMLLYNKWSNDIRIFPLTKRDNGPVASVDNPKAMLNIMDRQINISTNEMLQSYLRKIIVSANQLQRQYLPDNVNNSFDPDIIYQKILKLLQRLESKNRKLINENSKLRKKCGLADTQDETENPNEDSKIFKDLSFCKSGTKQQLQERQQQQWEEQQRQEQEQQQQLQQEQQQQQQQQNSNNILSTLQKA